MHMFIYSNAFNAINSGHGSSVIVECVIDPVEITTTMPAVVDLVVTRRKTTTMMAVATREAVAMATQKLRRCYIVNNLVPI